MSEELSVESRISPPALSCPKCDELLPYELGEVQCTMSVSYTHLTLPTIYSV